MFSVCSRLALLLFAASAASSRVVSSDSVIGSSSSHEPENRPREVLDSCGIISRSSSSLTAGFAVVCGSALVAFPLVLFVRSMTKRQLSIRTDVEKQPNIARSELCSVELHHALRIRPDSIIVRDSKGHSLLHWHPDKFVEHHRRSPSNLFHHLPSIEAVARKDVDPTASTIRYSDSLIHNPPKSTHGTEVHGKETGKHKTRAGRIRRKRRYHGKPMPSVSQEVVILVDPPDLHLPSFHQWNGEDLYRERFESPQVARIPRVQRPRGPRPRPVGFYAAPTNPS